MKKHLFSFHSYSVMTWSMSKVEMSNLALCFMLLCIIVLSSCSHYSRKHLELGYDNAYELCHNEILKINDTYKSREYIMRSKRLENGWRFYFDFFPEGPGGEIVITVYDSGKITRGVLL